MSMTDNPTDSAHLVAIGIVWFALAAPASSTALGPAPTRWIRVPTAVAGLGVGIVASLMLGAAIAYDGAIAAARRGDSPEVVRQLRTASQLDPANALYRRNLAAWLLGIGRGSEAALEIGRAVAQNPADATAWRIAAFAAQSAGDGPTAEDLARRALELRSVDPQNALLLAWLTEDVDDAAEAFDIALRIHPWLTAGAEWEPSFGGSATDRLESALASWSDAPDAASTRWLGSRAWLGAMLNRPLDEEEAGPQNAAVAAVIGCRLDEAAQMAGALQTPPTTNSLLVDILLARASDEAADDAIELAGLRSPRLGYLASVDVPGRSPLVDPEEDLRLYSRNALPTPPIGPIFPTTDSGLSEWLRDPAAAADRGAPDSGLARCR
jgi:tetratricopeptide (TPR) repeat protein